MVVATGFDRLPKLPDWPGRDEFRGELIHGSDYRNPAPYHGREVLVVGAGNTATEISVQLADAGAAQGVDGRADPAEPGAAETLGFPATPVGKLAEWLPGRVVDRVTPLFTRDHSAYGLPRSPYGLATEIRVKGLGVVVDRGIGDALRTGRVEVVGPVERFDAAEVLLAGGARLRPDAVIAATGYRMGLEPLVGHLGVLAADGRPLFMGAGTHPGAPRLYLTALPADVGQLPQLRRTSRAIGRAEARARAREARATPLPQRRGEGGAGVSFYDRIRHRSASSVAEQPATGSIEDLAGRNYCLIVTYKRSGEPVPTPVWFGVADGKVYTRTEADSWKVKRLRRNGRVRVAPCTMRGRPLGPPFEGVGRVLEPADFARAERAVADNYGIDRRLYMRFFGEAPDDITYIEVEPAGS